MNVVRDTFKDGAKRSKASHSVRPDQYWRDGRRQTGDLAALFAGHGPLAVAKYSSRQSTVLKSARHVA